MSSSSLTHDSSELIETDTPSKSPPPPKMNELLFSSSSSSSSTTSTTTTNPASPIRVTSTSTPKTSPLPLSTLLTPKRSNSSSQQQQPQPPGSVGGSSYDAWSPFRNSRNDPLNSLYNTPVQVTLPSQTMTTPYISLDPAASILRSPATRLDPLTASATRNGESTTAVITPRLASLSSSSLSSGVGGAFASSNNATIFAGLAGTGETSAAGTTGGTTGTGRGTTRRQTTTAKARKKLEYQEDSSSLPTAEFLSSTTTANGKQPSALSTPKINSSSSGNGFRSLSATNVSPSIVNQPGNNSPSPFSSSTSLAGASATTSSATSAPPQAPNSAKRVILTGSKSKSATPDLHASAGRNTMPAPSTPSNPSSSSTTTRASSDRKRARNVASTYSTANLNASQSSQGSSQSSGLENVNKCNCKKSKCLKLYCECFSASQFCDPNICTCENCLNSELGGKEREEAIATTKERNPTAFTPKVQATPESVRKHNFRGCNCKRSGCTKKYCECFSHGVFCTDVCKCTQCTNTSTGEVREGSASVLLEDFA